MRPRLFVLPIAEDWHEIYLISATGKLYIFSNGKWFLIPANESLPDDCFELELPNA